MEIKGLEIKRLGHDTFKIKSEEITVYTDPFKLEGRTDLEKADLILVSHEHFDHCDSDSIKVLSKESTELVGSKGAIEKLGKGKALLPGQETEVKGIKIKAVKAYNINKFRSPGVPFHPPESDMLGFVFILDSIKLYHAGDTDNIPEMKELADESIDIAMLPISGTYVMNEEEAVEAIKVIKPKIVVPMHYGTLKGLDINPEKFKEMVRDLAEVRIVE
ncbi:MBL fold metallo-hydrolase [Candidatus Woesearchaeota archaeon]|nr:MBL fold metallo-hydrolase [Candidatus Woesearchaeota archaeon]